MRAARTCGRGRAHTGTKQHGHTQMDQPMVSRVASLIPDCAGHF